MEYCQYGFTYYDEYMEYIDEGFVKLLGLRGGNEFERFMVGKKDFILRRKDENTYVLHSCYDGNDVYYVIVHCEKKSEEEIRKILLHVCNEMSEYYGEDHTIEVVDIISSSKEMVISEEEKKFVTEQYHINMA